MQTPGEFKGSRRGGTNTVALSTANRKRKHKTSDQRMGKLEACVTWQFMSLACCVTWPAGARMYTKSLMTPGSYNPIFSKFSRCGWSRGMLAVQQNSCSNARETRVCKNLTTRQPSASMRKNQPNLRNQRSTKSVQTQTSQVLREETHLFTNHKPTCLWSVLDMFLLSREPKCKPQTKASNVSKSNPLFQIWL